MPASYASVLQYVHVSVELLISFFIKSSKNLPAKSIHPCISLETSIIICSWVKRKGMLQYVPQPEFQQQLNLESRHSIMQSNINLLSWSISFIFMESDFRSKRRASAIACNTSERNNSREFPAEPSNGHKSKFSHSSAAFEIKCLASQRSKFENPTSSQLVKFLELMSVKYCILFVKDLVKSTEVAESERSTSRLVDCVVLQLSVSPNCNFSPEWENVMNRILNLLHNTEYYWQWRQIEGQIICQRS